VDRRLRQPRGTCRRIRTPAARARISPRRVEPYIGRGAVMTGDRPAASDINAVIDAHERSGYPLAVGVSRRSCSTWATVSQWCACTACQRSRSCIASSLWNWLHAVRRLGQVRTWDTASRPSLVWTLPRSPPRDIAGGSPGSFATRYASDPTTATAAGTVGADRADSGFSRLAAAEEVGELSPSSRCA
jgi:hypothetical protein